MKCVECGGPMKKGTEARYHYRECGLDNVYLCNITLHKCQNCGAVDLEIPAQLGLHAQLARILANQARPLTAKEFRFLRKHTGLSGKDFATHIGVTAETVSRWENGKENISGPADTVIRHIALLCTAPDDYSVVDLKKILENRKLYQELVLRFQRKEWEVSPPKKIAK